MGEKAGPVHIGLEALPLKATSQTLHILLTWYLKFYFLNRVSINVQELYVWVRFHGTDRHILQKYTPSSIRRGGANSYFCWDRNMMLQGFDSYLSNCNAGITSDWHIEK